MPVFRLDLAYDGSGFRGYARQTGQRTVQGELESALATLLKKPVGTSVAGRTDAGVHAAGQVVSFSIGDHVDLERLRRGLNGIIGPEISVLRCSIAADDFDARFSATWRRYRYLVDMRPAADPLTRHFVWHVGRSLDVPAMQSAASAMIGVHDFSSFCRSVDGKSNVREMGELSVHDSDDGLVIWAQANAFCHQMVRSIVGYLYDIGRGHADGAAAADVLVSRDRSRVATLAPPRGLTLWAVGYGL
jgi:tRNA pseudouridine38-40 synthase